MSSAECKERGHTKDTLLALIDHTNRKLIMTAYNKDLAEPFTSKDKILLWFERVQTNPPQIELISYHKFGALYSARKFLEAIIEAYPTKWISGDILLVNDWFRIRSDDKSSASVEDIMDHKYTKAEAAWQLSVPHTGYANAIRSYHWGSHPKVNQQKGLTNEELIAMGFPPKIEYEVAGTRTGRLPPAKPKRERLTSAETGDPVSDMRQRPHKKFPKKEGLISLADICAELKIEPREARTALRDAKIAKPDEGWCWATRSDAPDIAKLVEKRRKK